MLVFVEGGKLENPEKNPQSKGENQNKLNSHMTQLEYIMAVRFETHLIVRQF
jgi:hypothetical protein